MWHAYSYCHYPCGGTEARDCKPGPFCTGWKNVAKSLVMTNFVSGFLASRIPWCLVGKTIDSLGTSGNYVEFHGFFEWAIPKGALFCISLFLPIFPRGGCTQMFVVLIFLPLHTCHLFLVGRCINNITFFLAHSSILTTTHLKPIILSRGSRHAVAVLIAAGFCRFKARVQGVAVVVVPMEWWWLDKHP